MEKNFCSNFSDEFIKDVFLPITKQMGFPFNSINMIRNSTNIELESVFMQFGCSSNVLVNMKKMFKVYSAADKNGKLTNHLIDNLKNKWFEGSSNTETVKRNDNYNKETAIVEHKKRSPFFYCGKEIFIGDNGQIENF